jgi:hypothetical protein
MVEMSSLLKMSRSDATDIWLKAAIRSVQIQTLRTQMLRVYPRSTAGGKALLADPEREEERVALGMLLLILNTHRESMVCCTGLLQLVQIDKIGLTSRLFAVLANIESSGTIHQNWPDHFYTPNVRSYISTFFNTSGPDTEWSIKMLIELRKILMETEEEAGIIQELASRLECSFPEMPSLPVYKGFEGLDLEKSFAR